MNENAKLHGGKGPAAERWGALSIKGVTEIHRRCEDYARWTIRSIFPPDTQTAQDETEQLSGSMGAQGTNHLSNRIMQTLFPPHRPFFRIDLDDALRADLLAQIEGLGVEDAEAELRTILGNAERSAMRSSAKQPRIRTEAVNAIKQLMITGNAALHVPVDNKKPVQSFSLREYRVKREITGRVCEAIFRVIKKFAGLPQELQDKLNSTGEKHKAEDDIHVFTWLNLKNGKYEIVEYADMVQTGYTASYAIDDLPYLFLTWNHIRGEDYGRGLVEDYAGDFRSLEILHQAYLEGTVAMADIKFLVRPGSPIDVNELNESPSGSFHVGSEGDITVVQVDKYMDMQMVEKFIDRLEQRLSKVFLMMTGTVRQAERVTAEEIRLQALELDTGHGGIYSRLAEEWQLPLARLMLSRVDIKIGGELIEPVILTGVDSLSRAGDMDNLRQALTDLGLLNNVPEELRAEFDGAKFLAFVLTSHQIRPDELLKTKQKKQEEQAEMAAQQQQALNAEVTAKAMPQMASKLME